MAPNPPDAPDVWHDAMADLAYACAGADPAEAAGLVRQAHALLSTAPPAWGLQLGPLPERAQVEALLRSGAALEATLVLIENRAGFMLSHAPGGTHLATVLFEGLSGEATFEGASAALALIGAMAASLAGPERIGEETGTARSVARDLRLN